MRVPHLDQKRAPRQRLPRQTHGNRVRAGFDPVHGRREPSVALLELDRVVKRQPAGRVHRDHDSLATRHLPNRVRRLHVQVGGLAQKRRLAGDAADGAVARPQRRERRR